MCRETVRVGVICDDCWARMNAKAQQKQHRTPAMVDNFEDCALFGGRKS
jgi:acyl-ACP thioesterase